MTKSQFFFVEFVIQVKISAHAPAKTIQKKLQPKQTIESQKSKPIPQRTNQKPAKPWN